MQNIASAKQSVILCSLGKNSFLQAHTQNGLPRQESRTAPLLLSLDFSQGLVLSPVAPQDYASSSYDSYSCSRGLLSMFGALCNMCSGDTVAKSVAALDIIC